MNIFRKHTKTFPKSPSCTQSNPQVLPKCPQRVQSGAKVTEKPLRLAGLFVLLASSSPLGFCFWLECRAHFRFQPHQARTYTHHTCHSTSIWPKTGPKVTQSHPHIPQVTPKWPPSASKVATSSPHNCIKSLKSIGKMNIFRKHTKTFPKSPSCTQSNPQVLPKCPQRVQSGAKVTEKPLRLAGPQARLAYSGPS